MQQRMILTDTNIITDLDIAGVLEIFVDLENVYMSDMVLYEEINFKTCNLNTIKKIKTIKSSSLEVFEMQTILSTERKLSRCDVINFVIAKNHGYILATGDKNLRLYATVSNVDVIGVIKIIELLNKNGFITTEKTYDCFSKLYNSKKTRLPKEEILKRMMEIQEKMVLQ